jgi:SAM-dependent methyltransferase
MGITETYADQWGEFNVLGKSILDIGCGPWSMLLRCYNAGRLVGVDPLQYPPSVVRRYRNYGIEFLNLPGEQIPPPEQQACFGYFDEVWIYNVLQHVVDPQKVLQNAIASAAKLRIIEWVNIPPHPGHPHMLTAEALLQWLPGCKAERVETKLLSDPELLCTVEAFTGVFRCS